MTTAPPPAPPSPDPPAAPPPPSPPDPPGRPPLRRSRADKLLGGVCGGLAEYSGVDPLLWRVGFVALTLAGGTGVVVYALLWVLMPAGPGGPPATGPERPDAGPRSPVPGLTLAGLLIVVGLLVLLGRVTELDPGPHAVLAAALLVVGLGLAAAAFTGGRRAKGALVALGAVLSLAVVATAAAPWPRWEGHWDEVHGDRVHVPADPAEVRPVYEAGMGDVLVDLSGLDVGDLDAPVTTRLDAGLGDLEVLVPRSADLRVEVASGPGDVTVLGDEGSGGGWFPGSGSARWSGDAEPEIVLTVDGGLGDVEVSRA